MCGNDSFIISPESCYSFLWGFLSKYKGVIPNEPRKKKPDVPMKYWLFNRDPYVMGLFTIPM